VTAAASRVEPGAVDPAEDGVGDPDVGSAGVGLLEAVADGRVEGAGDEDRDVPASGLRAALGDPLRAGERSDAAGSAPVSRESA
jgi:hypothetical protein